MSIQSVIEAVLKDKNIITDSQRCYYNNDPLFHQRASEAARQIINCLKMYYEIRPKKSAKTQRRT